MAWCYGLNKSSRRKQTCEEIFMEKNSNKVLCSKCIVNEDSKKPEDQVSNVTIQRTPVTGDGPKPLSKLSDPDFQSTIATLHLS
jgi:hypothetical protein